VIRLASVAIAITIGLGGQGLVFTPVTEETIARAIAEGQRQSTPTPALDVLTARVNDALMIGLDGKAVDPSDMLRLLERAPFAVRLETPYSIVVAQSADAKRRFADAPKFSVADLNAGGLTVIVTSATSFVQADDIQNVVLTKGGTIVRPASNKVAPATIKNGAGATRSVAAGEFHFPLDAVPAAPFKVVCVGAAGNYELTIIESDLNRLRPK
jgi:hypothetical protein